MLISIQGGGAVFGAGIATTLIGVLFLGVAITLFVTSMSSPAPAPSPASGEGKSLCFNTFTLFYITTQDLASKTEMESLMLRVKSLEGNITSFKENSPSADTPKICNVMSFFIILPFKSVTAFLLYFSLVFLLR